MTERVEYIVDVLERYFPEDKNHTKPRVLYSYNPSIWNNLCATLKKENFIEIEKDFAILIDNSHIVIVGLSVDEALELIGLGYGWKGYPVHALAFQEKKKKERVVEVK